MSEAAESQLAASSSEEVKAGRGLAKHQEGIVVGDKMDKSVVVKVTTHKMHPKYKKFVLSSQRYMAHDEKNECAEGDEVRIVECRPLSKNKRWRVQSVLKKAV